MDNSNKIVPPHLNAEVYRTDTTGTCTQSYLEYIRLQSDGTVLVGCSELTGRYWNGGASIFEKRPEDNKIHKTTKKDIYLTSGTADGCFVENSNKIFLCEDSGAVSLWSSKEDDAWNQWGEDLSVAEHDGAVLSVDCLDPNKEYVTAGADGNIKVWDTIDLICIRNYFAAHSRSIYGVSVRPMSHTSFATGSLDYCISLWYDKIDLPALELFKNDCGVRCLQWFDENNLIFGDEAGFISLIDIRKPEIATKLIELPAAVHKVVIQPGCNRLSVCCDNKIVSVFDISEDLKLSLIYENRNLHSNFVRGMVWDNDERNVLHTVGWDGELKTHRLPCD
ncbi:methylosome protein 50-like [Nymphalis io]|uniref:methylosome protein 50-like n=1 Tax=Inachis io TaxID=171585 RepID=UPI0021699FC2|nr:methylosome protein 50-like [Nymphalis io]